MANNDLLPPDDGLLLPPDDAPGVVGTRDDVFDQMSEKVAAGAKLLGAKAAELTATQGPVLKEQAQKLGAKMADVAAQARDRAEEAAREASVTLKDPSLRKGFWQTYKRRILAGAGAFIVIAGGGYGFGCYQATKAARDVVDTYLIRGHLQQQVSYRDISATPFGSARLSGIRLSVMGQPVEIASLSVGGLRPDGTAPERLDIAWSGLSLPASSILSGDDLAALIGSGFAKLQGEGSFQYRFDSSAHEVEIKTAGSFSKAGSWDFAWTLANTDPASLGRIVEGGNAFLPAVQLRSLSGSLDASGFEKRTGEIPRSALPAEEGRPLLNIASTQFSRSLIEAGMSPADARDMLEALQKFARTGDKITLKSRTDYPVPLFATGFLGQPQLISFPAFLAATKLSVSN